VDFWTWVAHLPLRRNAERFSAAVAKMMIPDLTGLSAASNQPEVVQEDESAADVVTITKTLRRVRNVGTSPNGFSTATRGSVARRQPPRVVGLIQERQNTNCPSGKAYYSCSSNFGGFVGCCSSDPCTNNGCPDNKSSTSGSSKATSSTSSAQRTSTGSSQTASKTSSSSRSGNSTSSRSTPAIQTATASGSLGASPSASGKPSSESPPPCPAGNGTTYSDISNIAYQILCGIDNTYDSWNSIQVATGGYGECFSACSTSGACGGFVNLSDEVCAHVEDTS
jgi:hypothetical protein